MMFGFYMTVYKDEIWARRMCQQVHRIYPGAPILVMSDGPMYRESFNGLRHTYLVPFDRRLKLYNDVNNSAGTYSHRCMTTVAATMKACNLDLMFKVDPDSYLWRKIRHVPDDQWFGRVYTNTTPLGTYNCCAGGGWGIRRKLVNDLVDSKILLDESLVTHGYKLTYARYFSRAFNKLGDKGRTRELVIREDAVMGWAVQQMGVEPVMWDEVDAYRSGERIQESPYEFAITHPVRAIY